jgi:hypothetical protein
MPAIVADVSCLLPRVLVATGTPADVGYHISALMSASGSIAADIGCGILSVYY